VVEGHAAVAELAGVVLDRAREDLVVVLTSRAGEHQPSLDVEDVRAIVGPRALIYFLPTGPLSFDLADRVPDRRGPYNGSLRVWLPDVSPESDRREHPQVFDATGEYGPRSLRQLAYGLREAHTARGIEPHLDPVLAHRSLEIIRVLDEAAITKRGYEEQLTRAREERDEAAQRARDEADEAVKRAHKDRDEALKRERLAERRLRIAERERGVSQMSTQDSEGALMELILQRWLETLSHEERTQHPLGRYVLGPEFVRSAEGLIDLVRDRLAFVCAMIACNRVGDLAALAQSPLSHNSKAHHDHDSLKDSESAWQCSLTRPDSQTPPPVRYLQHADGTISFTGMGAYKAARSGR
jgi:vacuolar-type H+-ATPase subunit H